MRGVGVVVLWTVLAIEVVENSGLVQSGWELSFTSKGFLRL